MKFKKFFAVLSAVSMLASVAAVNASADEPILGADPASKPYSFEYAITAEGAVVKNVTVAEGIDEVVIPDETDAGIKVVGVENFAFRNADVATIVVPDTFKLDSIGEVAFLTNDDVAAYIVGEGFNLSEKLTDENAAAIAYVANTVKFMGKTDWTGTEEELVPADKVFENVANKISAGNDDIKAGEFVEKLYTVADKSTVVRAEDEDTLEKMSQKSYDNFQAWVKFIPVDVTLKGTKGSAAEEYATGKALVKVAFAENETHLIGDANQDGVVNVRDCATIARAMANKSKFDEIIKCTICADFNQDGEVNVRDAANLANAIATGKIDTSNK